MHGVAPLHAVHYHRPRCVPHRPLSGLIKGGEELIERNVVKNCHLVCPVFTRRMGLFGHRIASIARCLGLPSQLKN